MGLDSFLRGKGRRRGKNTHTEGELLRTVDKNAGFVTKKSTTDAPTILLIEPEDSLAAPVVEALTDALYFVDRRSDGTQVQSFDARLFYTFSYSSFRR